MRKPNHSPTRNNYGRNRGGKYRSNGSNGGGGNSGGGNSGGGNDSQSLGRQKKHAMTQKDKFQAMARDQLSNGDRVTAEYYFQHVEHYSRVIAEITEREEILNPRQQGNAEEDAGVEGDQGDDREFSQGGQEHSHAQGHVDEGSQSEDTQPRAARQPRRSPRRDRPVTAAIDNDAEEIPLPMDILPDVSSATN